MSNPISSLFSGSPSLDKVSLEKARRKSTERAEDGTQAQTTARAAKAALAEDELVLSEIAKRAMAEPEFDRSKVESIKQAIQDGNYPLNSRRIAESFVAIEKLID